MSLLKQHTHLLVHLVKPPWLDPVPAPSEPAELGAPWQRGRRLSSLPGSPLSPYSTCPSSAAAGAPPPGAGPPPHAAELQYTGKQEDRFEGANLEIWNSFMLVE